MTEKREIEVFSADCPVCREAVQMVESMACPSCNVTVLDMGEKEVAGRARRLGIRSVPAVVVDEELADCCAGRGITEQSLRSAGVGQPI